MDPNKIIPTPCHENWNAMPGTDHKRFCDKCDHHVHDITDLNFTQIDQLRAKNNGKLCGVIRLSRNIALTAGIASLAACNNTQETLGDIVAPKNLTETIPKQASPEKPPAHRVDPTDILIGEIDAQPKPKPLEIPPMRLMGAVAPPPALPPKVELNEPNQIIMGKIPLPEPRVRAGIVVPLGDIGED